MRKLRIALLALFAMVFSLALFACGSKDQIDTIEVNGTASIALTDADTETTARAKLDELEFYCTYLGNTEDHTFAASEYTVDWTGVTFGKTGNYTAKVTTSKNNDAKAYAEVAVSITHAFGNPDADGVQVCTFCNAVAQTKTINDTFSIGAWAKGVTVGKDNEYVLTDNRIGNNTAFVARLDKGMSITLKGTGKATSNDNPWYFPILGVANIEEDWSIIDRQDGWSIYGAMNGVLAQLSGKPFSDSDPETGWPGAEAATMYRVYVDGKGSATADYYDKGDVPIELTWEYGTDNSFLMQWNNPTGNGIRTARVLLSDRQFYNALLHGEFFDATFTEVQIIQTRKLESVDSITVNTVEKVLENKYLNNNCFNIGITYAGNLKDTAVNDGMVTVYGNTEKVTKLPDDNTAQGGMAYNGKGNAWEDLSTTKMTKNFQSYKVRVQTGLDWFEQLLPEADVAKINAAIIPNAVDHGNPNEITVDNVVFRATDLSKVEFTQNGEKAGVAIEGAAATLSTDQAGKLTMGSGSGKHYVAFTLYANGATTFAGTATIEGTKGYAKASEDGKKLDVVLAVTADLKEATIKGVNGGTDIVVSFGEMLGCSTSSTLSFNTLKINETKDLTVEYDISGLTGVTDAASVASKLSLAINNMLVPFNTTGGTLNTGSFTAISGFAIKSAAYASGKLTLVYTIPAMDASKPVSYTFNLVNNESGAVLASDKLYYDLTFAENDNVRS